MNTIRNTVLRLLGEIAPNADLVAIEADVSFHDQFELDSIDFLRLMLGLEQALDVTIFDIDYPKLSTLQGCEAYLRARMQTLQA